jgi:hypothetical protein
LEVLNPDQTIREVLNTIAVGATDLSIDSSDDPSWATTIASPECEYWIAGAQDKLSSLAELKVFALVPCSEVLHGQYPLKGKLVCKHKWNNTGKITWYKVCYVTKGFAQ